MLLVKVKTPQCSGKLEAQISFKQELVSGKMHTMEQRGIFCLSELPSLLERDYRQLLDKKLGKEMLWAGKISIYS